MKIRNFVRNIVCAAGAFGICLSAPAQTNSDINYHCAADTAKAMSIVREFYEPGGNPAEKMGPIAELFVGTECRPVTQEDSTGHLQIRLDAFDEMSFLNAVAALSRLATTPGHTRINEFESALRDVSYRRGEDKGFATKMVYASDWIVDNKSRGIVKELTENYSNVFKTKSLDHITRHRNDYKALKDSMTYEDQRMVEMGFRTHKIPHMKRESTEWKDIDADLRDGDIIMLLSPQNDIDTFEIGIIRKRADGFHFIHPSVEAGKVVEESEVLPRYIKRNSKKTYGYRWLRLAQ